MNRMLFTLAASALFCVAACEKEKVPDPATATPPAATAPGPSAVAVPAPTAATPAAAAGSPAETIPVAADFEEEAEKSITKANYKAELGSLEAELK
jgi:hypothetical protein